jgi:hypothetical protein
MAKKCTCFQKILVKIKNILIFKGIINALRVGYLPLVIGSGIGRRLDNEPDEIPLNTPILVYVFLPVFFALVFVYKYNELSLRRPSIAVKFSGLYMELRYTDFDAMLYWVFFLLRRIVFSAALHVSIFSVKLYLAFII